VTPLRRVPRQRHRMEAFEQFTAIHLEQEGLVIAGPVKLPVTRQTKRKDYHEVETHGYGVDLVGVCADRLVLATVKSFLDSRGVQAKEVIGEAGNVRASALLNGPVIRKGVITPAAMDFGYPTQPRCQPGPGTRAECRASCGSDLGLRSVLARL